ncbi:hypothetical protein BaRGS_00004426 [Batillaria attramentaria]|uniref:Uncharacterized protein n=1 Tax=Batillaria attramentaria TaxID=370345 RepID=A0ABD0LX94_9CAEN
MVRPLVVYVFIAASCCTDDNGQTSGGLRVLLQPAVVLMTMVRPLVVYVFIAASCCTDDNGQTSVVYVFIAASCCTDDNGQTSGGLLCLLQPAVVLMTMVRPLVVYVFIAASCCTDDNGQTSGGLRVYCSQLLY